jgi:hypothetical protein
LQIKFTSNILTLHRLKPRYFSKIQPDGLSSGR